MEKFYILVLSFLVIFPALAYALCPTTYCPTDQSNCGTVLPGRYNGSFTIADGEQSWYTDASSFTKVNYSATITMDSDDDLDLYLYDPNNILVRRSEHLGSYPEQVSFCGAKGIWRSMVHAFGIGGGCAPYNITISATNVQCCSNLDCPSSQVCQNGVCLTGCSVGGQACAYNTQCCSGICNLDATYGSRCCNSACPPNNYTCSGSSIVYRKYYCDDTGGCAFADTGGDVSKPDSSGFIRDWLILGMFYDEDCGCASNCISWLADYCDNWFDFANADAIGGNKIAGNTWFIHHNSDSMIDFENEIFEPGTANNNMTAFAFAYIQSPDNRDVKLKIGNYGGITVWLNGVNILENQTTCRSSITPDQVTVNAHLNQGTNRLLIRMGHKTGGWAMYVRFINITNNQPITDINIFIPTKSYDCSSFNDQVSYSITKNTCCAVYSMTYYAIFSCSSGSCIQTTQSKTTTFLAGKNEGLSCGSPYCSGVYGVNKTCISGTCTAQILFNCADSYACTQDSCTGSASGCSHCVNQGWVNTTCSSPIYPCCSGMTLKSCPIGNVCCPPDSCTYSAWTYSSYNCKRCRTKTCSSYTCPASQGGVCSPTSSTTTECENVNEGMQCNVGSYECIGDCKRGKRLYNCQAGSCSDSGKVVGIAGYWKFDEGQGTTVYDSSGNGNNGVLYNAQWVTGKYGNATNFTSTSKSKSNVTIPFSSSLNITKDITISMWISRKTFNVDQYMLSLYPATCSHSSYELGFDVNKPTLIFCPGTAGPSQLDASVDITDSGWHHIAGTFNGTHMKIYVDGVLSNSKSATGYINTSFAKNLILGGYGFAFNGSIDEVKIYPWVLTDDEVNNEYMQGPYNKLASCSPFSCSAGACTSTCNNCGGSSVCNGLTSESSCGLNKYCDSACNCVNNCTVFDRLNCPGECTVCQDDMTCKFKSSVECQPGDCSIDRSKKCGSHCKWEYCAGTNANCNCLNGVCQPCSGDCIDYACSMQCAPGECLLQENCYDSGSCHGMDNCVNGIWQSSVAGNGHCECGEDNINTPQDCLFESLKLFRGWNLISLPFKGTVNIQSENCHADILSFHYWKDKSWNRTIGFKNIQIGVGYWVNPGWFVDIEPCFINFTGGINDRVASADLPSIGSGYNLIGATGTSDSIASVSKSGCSTIKGSFYWDAISKQWIPSSTMDPKFGYWVVCE